MDVLIEDVHEPGTDYVLVGDLKLGVGELTLTIKNDEGEPEETTVNITLIEFKDLRSDDVYKMALPMDHPVGDAFFTGAIYMQIRDLWEDWFKDHGPANNDNS